MLGNEATSSGILRNIGREWETTILTAPADLPTISYTQLHRCVSAVEQKQRRACEQNTHCLFMCRKQKHTETTSEQKLWSIINKQKQ